MNNDNYEIHRPIASGGMGAVYSGRTRPGGVPVAFKTVEFVNQPPPYLDREFRILSGLSHPNIVRVYEKFTLGNKLWFAMEKIDGTSIDRAIPKAADLRLTAFASSVFGQFQQALNYIHARQLVHAELSPGNILVTESGVLKLVDFEHCRVLNIDESEYWSPGTIAGAPAYMAPEHLAGSPVIESDYFVVGTLLFECLLGSKPFRSCSIGEVLREIYMFDPKSILATVPDLDTKIVNILRHLWAKETATRHIGWKLLHAATSNACLTDMSIAYSGAPRGSDLSQASRFGDESLTHDMIVRVHRSAITAGLHFDRHALLAGLDPAISAALPIMPNPGAQLLSDLHTLNQTRPLDGSTPLLCWLSNAIALRTAHREVEVFRECESMLLQRGLR